MNKSQKKKHININKQGNVDLTFFKENRVIKGIDNLDNKADSFKYYLVTENLLMGIKQEILPHQLEIPPTFLTIGANSTKGSLKQYFEKLAMLPSRTQTGDKFTPVGSSRVTAFGRMTPNPLVIDSGIQD